MAQVRRFKDADKEAVHTLFTNGMKDNMNALIWEAIKNVPGAATHASCPRQKPKPRFIPHLYMTI
eukprot:1161836-Pelagomonas_calceolata.AAC.1